MKKNFTNKLLPVLLIFITGITPLFMKAQTPVLGKSSVKQVIAAMTLEEKVKLVVGTGMEFADILKILQSSGTPVVGKTELLVPGAAGTSHPIPRFGVSAMVLSDGPAGLRINPTRKDENKTYFCTAFPVATLLASTWDTQMVYQVGQAMGNEVLEYGADLLLAPAMNIHRNPLCGRNFEYYSEDPLLAGKIAAAMVNGVESQGVGTSLKHFAANNSETNRNTLNTIVSERALREIYLEGFRIAVQESQPWTVMSSYNLINGVYTSESHDLLTKILRDEWGFKGYVMTDWYGGKDAVAQMKAGNDQIMPGMPKQIEGITEAVKSGKLDEKILDQNVERILNVLVQSPRFKGYAYSNTPDLKAHALVSRQAAAEGMVLLKNDNAVLPIDKKIKTVAVFGNSSYDVIIGGTGSGDVNEAYKVALAEGLKNAGFAVPKGLMVKYNNYISESREKQPKPANAMMALLQPPTPIAEMEMDAETAKKMAWETDMAIITIGRNSGEGEDRTDTEGDFRLNSNERKLIELVTSAFHANGKKVVVVLSIGGVIETASWRNLPDAILLAWQAGEESGNSTADILTGKANPSGKLTMSFPLNYQDIPSAKNFPGIVVGQPNLQKPADKEDLLTAIFNSKPAEITYQEGIYVGYRYYETFNVKTAYEFGYGLSYTTFGYGNLKINSPKFDEKADISFTVTNNGKVAGKEVVQLYLTAPAGKLDKPFGELKGFGKTKLLQPGESQTLSFSLNARNLASFNTEASAWIADQGIYTLKIGASSKDIRLRGTFALEQELVAEKVHKALAPEKEIKELKR